MNLPPRFRSDLWRRLSEAQDAALADDADSLREVDRVVAARVASSNGRGGLRRVASRWRVGVGAAVLVTAAAAAILVQGGVYRRSSPRSSELSLTGAGKAPAERAFVADARSDLPLRFTDGSTVTFRAGSAGRMQRLSGSGAEIVLERGWLEAHVIHADTTLWLVHAGPYRVRVTGTRFAVKWVAAIFELNLYEGAVIVDGAVLGAGVPLRAGHRLKIASGVVLIEPLGAPVAGPSAGAGAAAPGPAVGPVVTEPTEEPAGTAPPGVAASAGTLRADTKMSARAAGGREAGGREAMGRENRAATESDAAGIALADNAWMALAERGEYREALVAAKRVGWGELCRRLDARRLLTLGDVARYSGARAEAKQAFAALVSRFRTDRLAADAVFSLGRLAFESSHPREATHWFHRYVSDWPDAPLADQAAGRLLECAIRLDDREGAISAARRYLLRAPAGPHATLAREVLAVPGRP